MIHKSLSHYLIMVLTISSLAYGMEKAEHLKTFDHQLISAAWNNKIEQAKKLLEEPDIDINFTDCYWHNALNVASRKGHFDIVKLLIDKGADINLREAGGWTPLINACKENHVDIAKFLIEKGADINLPDYSDRTPLILTIQSQAIQLLLDKGASINLTTHDKWTALHFAAYNNKPDALNALLCNGINIYLRNREGETARDIAQRYNYPEIVAAINLEITKKKTGFYRLRDFFKTSQSIEYLLAIPRK